MDEKKVQEQSEKTTQLILSLFDNLGYPTQVDEYNRIYVGYQGVTFMCLAYNSYVQFMDPAWIAIDVDTNSFRDLADAINETNRSTWTISMFYVRCENNETENNDTIEISTTRDILLSPVIPYLEDYVRNVLKSLIDTRETFITTFDRRRRGRRNPPSIQ